MLSWLPEELQCVVENVTFILQMHFTCVLKSFLYVRILKICHSETTSHLCFLGFLLLYQIQTLLITVGVTDTKFHLRAVYKQLLLQRDLSQSPLQNQ